MTHGRKQEERQALRKQVLEAAESIATAEGWEAVTMRRLAASVKYTPPTLYELFGSKTGVLTALVQQGFMTLQNAIDKIDPALSARERLRDMCLAYWQFSRAYPERYQIMFDVGVSHFKRPKTVEGATVFKAFHAAAVAVHPGATPAASYEITLVTWSAMHGLISLTLIEESKALKGAEITTLIDRLVAMVAPIPVKTKEKI